MKIIIAILLMPIIVILGAILLFTAIAKTVLLIPEKISELGLLTIKNIIEADIRKNKKNDRDIFVENLLRRQKERE